MTQNWNLPDNPGQPRQDHFPPHVQQHVPPQWQQQRGQLQPYQQPYPQPYGTPAGIRPRSPGTGLVLGLLLPGAGCMYAGRAGIGILILALWLLSIPLTLVYFIGVLTGFALWVTSAVLGWTMTREWNAVRGIIS